jgi:hypothetical protein
MLRTRIGPALRWWWVLLVAAVGWESSRRRGDEFVAETREFPGIQNLLALPSRTVAVFDHGLNTYPQENPRFPVRTFHFPTGQWNRLTPPEWDGKPIGEVVASPDGQWLRVVPSGSMVDYHVYSPQGELVEQRYGQYGSASGFHADGSWVSLERNGVTMVACIGKPGQRLRRITMPANHYFTRPQCLTPDGTALLISARNWAAQPQTETIKCLNLATGEVRWQWTMKEEPFLTTRFLHGEELVCLDGGLFSVTDRSMNNGFQLLRWATGEAVRPAEITNAQFRIGHPAARPLLGITNFFGPKGDQLMVLDPRTGQPAINSVMPNGFLNWIGEIRPGEFAVELRDSEFRFTNITWLNYHLAEWTKQPHFRETLRWWRYTESDQQWHPWVVWPLATALGSNGRRSHLAGTDVMDKTELYYEVLPAKKGHGWRTCMQRCDYPIPQTTWRRHMLWGCLAGGFAVLLRLAFRTGWRWTRARLAKPTPTTA